MTNTGELDQDPVSMETMAYLCASGILARHPKLRVVIVESGSGWLAWALHAMDDA